MLTLQTYGTSQTHTDMSSSHLSRIQHTMSSSTPLPSHRPPPSQGGDRTPRPDRTRASPAGQLPEQRQFPQGASSEGFAALVHVLEK